MNQRTRHLPCCRAVDVGGVAWLAHRRTAPDLDWASTATTRAERPLLCAVTKAGKVTGTKLSDKAVARLVKQAATAAGLDAEGVFRRGAPIKEA